TRVKCDWSADVCSSDLRERESVCMCVCVNTMGAASANSPQPFRLSLSPSLSLSLSLSLPCCLSLLSFCVCLFVLSDFSFFHSFSSPNNTLSLYSPHSVSRLLLCSTAPP